MNAFPQLSPQVTATILQKARSTPGFKEKLKALHARAFPLYFNNVAEPAFSFIIGLLTEPFPLPKPQNIWIICRDATLQEHLFNETQLWNKNTVFLPELHKTEGKQILLDPEITAQRLSLLHGLSKGTLSQKTIFLTKKSLINKAPAAKTLLHSEKIFKIGQELPLETFLEELVLHGYESVPQIYRRGQLAQRGGILDIFPWQSEFPCRIDLFDTTIESIRIFDIDTQESFKTVDSYALLIRNQEEENAQIADYIQQEDLCVAIECAPAQAHMFISSATLSQSREDFSLACYPSPLGAYEAGDFILQQNKREAFIQQLHEWKKEHWLTAMFFNNEGEIERFKELLPFNPEIQNLFYTLGQLRQGFCVPSAKISVLSSAEIFGRYQHTRSYRRFQKEHQFNKQRAQIVDLSSLKHNEYVVHSQYGIGRYKGIHAMDHQSKANEEVIVLEYAQNTRLYVPLEHAYLVSRYIGSGKKVPALHSLGDHKWQRTKKAAERSILDYASQLLSLQAERETKKGFAHLPDNKWQEEFEHSFLYQETPDQLQSIAETKKDMESPTPMDRLVCGDVGFGKTEVAIRAAFKAVMSGKQVVILVPTTILAQQHYQTFKERMSDYPIHIDVISRLRTPTEQKQILHHIKKGVTDIAIGTHRLISSDVEFKDLGLVVVDEEQRFGVKHKERFKELFHLVDVLTLSATPIPRTLYLSLMGAKDMSTIDTPPPNRYPVSTTICPYDERIIKKAITHELDRDGQVYFLHNRVKSIEKIKERLLHLFPQAHIAVGHGQMEKEELELVMHQFVEGKIDILVCTTIIESGIDIPNANTIIIDRADRFGLADLYQLRGRVGRAQHKAYAFLLLPPDLLTVGDARKRIQAIKQYNALGSGFRIAMRDLEIRGAGNLLGTRQSGHIAAIGFELYCQLLKKSIAKFKGNSVPQQDEVALRIDFLAKSEAEFLQQKKKKLPAYIPTSYIENAALRIQAYREIAHLETLTQLKKLTKNWEDRFGKIPHPVHNLFICKELKLLANKKGMTSVEIKNQKLMLTRRGDYIFVKGKFPRLQSLSLEKNLEEALNLIKYVDSKKAFIVQKP